MDVDGVELTAYYFPSTDDDCLYTLKRQCYLLGLQIRQRRLAIVSQILVPVSVPAQVKYVKDWIDVSVKLGAPCLRVFAGGTPEGHSEAEAPTMDDRRFEGVCGIRCTSWCLGGVGKSRGITSTADQVIDLVTSVDSEWVGVNLDTGNFCQDPYGSLARVAPYAVTAHAKTEIPKEGDDKEEADFSEIVRILNAQGVQRLSINRI